jgi:hypothetical protein
MIETTLTLENLTLIYDAMSKIKESNRSNFFNQYFNEVENRIKEEKLLENINKTLYGYKKMNEDPNISEDDKLNEEIK